MQTWWTSSARAPVKSALQALHEHAANVTALHRPICLASGRCCNFKTHDHILVVTGLEAAWTLRNSKRIVTAEAAEAAVFTGACVFLTGNQCSIHEARPTGCRSYFCDKGDETWQAKLAETMHRSIRQLHDELNIPYLCAEWGWLVKSLSIAQQRGVLSEDSPY